MIFFSATSPIETLSPKNERTSGERSSDDEKKMTLVTADQS